MLCLISGGGSALLALPAEGMTLEDKQAVNRALLASGADITAMNTVRKHLSAIKGGRLAAAAFPAETVSLLISDVPGDDPSVIASGPTVADPTTFADARAVLARYGIDPPDRRRARTSPQPPRRRRSRATRGSPVPASRSSPRRWRASRRPRGRRPRRRRHAADPRRRDRGRGARGRQGDGRHRAFGARRTANRSRRPRCCSPAARRR